MNALEVWQRVGMNWGGGERHRDLFQRAAAEVSEGSHLKCDTQCLSLEVEAQDL